MVVVAVAAASGYGAATQRDPPPLGAPVPADASALALQQAEVDALVDALVTMPLDEADAKLRSLERHQLITIARVARCRFAMRAARLLEQAGDPSHLPRRGARNEPPLLGRALCLIAAIEQPEHRREYLREYLPETGNVTIRYEACPDDDPQRPKGGIVESIVARATATGHELRGFGVDGFRCRSDRTAHVCEGIGRAESVEITLMPDDTGKLHVTDISARRLTGCS